MLKTITKSQQKKVIEKALKTNEDAIKITLQKLGHNVDKKTFNEKKNTVEFLHKHCWTMDFSGKVNRPIFHEAPIYIVQIGGELSNTYSPSYESHLLVCAQLISKIVLLRIENIPITAENLLDVWDSGFDPRIAIVHTIVDDITIPRYVKSHPIIKSLIENNQHKIPGHFVNTKSLEIDYKNASLRLATEKYDQGLYTEYDLEILESSLHEFDDETHSYEFMKALITLKQEKLLEEIFHIDMTSNIYFHFTPYCTFFEESNARNKWLDTLKSLYTINFSREYAKLKGYKSEKSFSSIFKPRCPECGNGSKYLLESEPFGVAEYKAECIMGEKQFTNEVGDTFTIEGCGYNWHGTIKQIIEQGAAVDFPANSLLWALAGLDGIIYEDPGYSYKQGSIIKHDEGKGDNPEMLASAESLKIAYFSGQIINKQELYNTSIPISYVQFPQITDPSVKQRNELQLSYGTTNSSSTALMVHGMSPLEMFEKMLSFGYIPSEILAKNVSKQAFKTLTLSKIWYPLAI